jgi:uncharacterized protein with GYD domain
MLHMVVNSHNAESCAFRSDEDDTILSGAFDAFEKSAADHGMSVIGSWAHRIGHEIFMVVESPDAHTVEEAVIDAGLIGRTHTRVLSVMSLQDAIESVDETRD